MTKEELKNNIFIGVIEDNNDPQKLGRCKVRVLNVFEEIPIEDIPWAKPWKDLSGNIFSIPEKGKVVSVVFDMGSIYKPEFIYAEHYNTNLEDKLKKLSDDDYPTFKSVLFDQSTQIFRTKSDGLVLDHEYTNINLDEVGNINLNLKNNGAYLKLGTPDADQQAVLGNHFMDWMDKLVDTLSATPYMGNLMAPVFPSPTLLPILSEYRTSRATSKFLSKNVFIVDNTKINTQTRDYVNQDGDKWKSTVTRNDITTTKPNTPNKEPDRPQPIQDQQQTPVVGTTSSQTDPAKEPPTDVVKSGNPIVKSESPDSLARNVNKEGSPRGAQSVRKQIGSYENGSIPYKQVFKKSKRLIKDLARGAYTNDPDPFHCQYLYPPMADAFDALMVQHDTANYPGKYPSVIATDGYRTYFRQAEMKGTKDARQASMRATAGTSPHGWGNAVDISWGISVALSDDTPEYMGAIFRHPTYQWFWHNAWKYGIYNPFWARSGSGGFEEWWHWEYDPTQNKQYPSPDLIAKYSGPFTRQDYSTLSLISGSKVGYMKVLMEKNESILLYDENGNYQGNNYIF